MWQKSLDLSKEHLLDLTKTALDVTKDYGLEGVKAQVGVLFDVSGSMEGLYRSGNVQEAADRALALGMNFDDNRSIDVFAFDTGARYVDQLTDENFFGFVDKKITRLVGGGTNYAPAMKAALKHYGFEIPSATVKTTTESVPKKGLFGKLFGGIDEVVKTEIVQSEGTKPANLQDPVYLLFITDGENADYAEAEHVIRESAKFGVFWKFVGIGRYSFSFLEKLDDMSGRFLDNADFIKVNDIATIEEKELYRRLLDEFKDWIDQARAHNLIK